MLIYMLYLVKLIPNTLYIKIIIIHSFFVHVCSIFKNAKSGLSTGWPNPTRPKPFIYIKGSTQPKSSTGRPWPDLALLINRQTLTWSGPLPTCNAYTIQPTYNINGFQPSASNPHLKEQSPNLSLAPIQTPFPPTTQEREVHGYQHHHTILPKLFPQVSWFLYWRAG